ncbi:MAG: hypothetical protein MHM6MM_005894 [Cercozoa sp. M6MM]
MEHGTQRRDPATIHVAQEQLLDLHDELRRHLESRIRHEVANLHAEASRSVSRSES